MAYLNETFINLYSRDLDRLSNEVKLISDNHLWETRPGISNSCGILVQHLIGNLHHFIGTQLGNTGYKREREREFTNTGISKKELLKQIGELKEMIGTVVSAIKENDFQINYSPDFPYDATVFEGLMHLYGHLDYHLGQVNYLRRMIEEKV